MLDQRLLTSSPALPRSARLAVLFYRIGPYHYARLRAAGSVANVTAIEFSNVDPTYAWDEVKGEEGFRRVTLYQDVSVESQSARQIFQRMSEALEQAQPDVVAIAGWYDRCSLAALRWALRRSVPVVLMSETTAWDEKRRWWKEAIKRGVVRLCGSALVGGRAHLDYAARLGVARERIFLGYDAVDNDFFATKTDEVRRAQQQSRDREGAHRDVEADGMGCQVSSVRSHVPRLESQEQSRDREGASRDVGPQGSGNRTNGGMSAEAAGEGDLRKKHGLPEKYFLASARFVEKKNLLRLLEAYSEYLKMCEGEYKIRSSKFGLQSSEREVGSWKLEVGSSVSAPAPTLGGQRALRSFSAGGQSVVSGPVVSGPVVSGPVVSGPVVSGPVVSGLPRRLVAPKPGEGGSAVKEDPVVPWSLVLLGDGPLRDKIQLRVSALGLRGHVHLPGFKQYPELPLYYALASAFIHASTVEQWGLVVNEAMASGLPVLLSNRCGCTVDLLEEGRNGFQFDPYDSDMLASQMFEMSTLPEDQLRSCGAASREIAMRWGPQAFSEGLQRAVEAARIAGPAQRTWLRESFLVGLTWTLKNVMENGQPKPRRKNAASAARVSPPQAEVDFQPTRAPLAIEPIYIRLRFRGRNVLAMPHEPRALHGPALARYQPFTRKRRAYHSLMNAAIRLNRPEWVGTLSATAVPPEERFDYQSWLGEMQLRLGRDLYGVVTWPSESSRRRLYVHLFGRDLEAVAFAKILLSPDDAGYFETAASTYEELNAKSLNRVRVPRLLGRERFGQAAYLLFESLPEGARPLRLQRSADVRDIIKEYAGEPQRMTPDQLLSLDWWSRYATRLSGKAAPFHAELTDLLSEGVWVRRAHGDFGLSNIVAAASLWWIFDWEMSHPQAPVLTDEVGFFMSFSVGKAPRSPSRYFASFQEHFLKGGDNQRRLDVMLALAFRHAAGIPDASAYICNWTK